MKKKSKKTSSPYSLKSPVLYSVLFQNWKHSTNQDEKAHWAKLHTAKFAPRPEDFLSNSRRHWEQRIKPSSARSAYIGISLSD